MSKLKGDIHQQLNHCSKWGDFQEVANDNGIKHLRFSGGHDVCGNEHGSMSFSTHEHGELSKGLRCSLKRQILNLLGLLCLFGMFVLIGWLAFSQMFV